MIVKNVCLLLEALSIVICLHHLYGEKFRLDIATISFLSIDMIIMTAINYFGLSKTYTMVIYPIIVLYCGIRFGFQVKKLAVNIVLCIVGVGGIQLIVALLFYYLWDIEVISDVRLLLINGIAFLIIIFLLSLFHIERLSSYLKEREKVLLITVVDGIVMILFCLINYKEFRMLELNQAILLFVSIIFIFGLSGQLSKYKVRAKEVETELKMQKLYADSFQGLIDSIRLRQHEFNNHIHTIYSQHYAYHTYEELVNAQKDYCEHVTKENRFYKLLFCGNPVIAGFLYGRFIEVDKMGINIAYEVSIKELEVGIPIYKIVEVLGDLINNAVEALVADTNRKGLYIAVIETNRLFIEVRNESSYIEYNDLAEFFVKGYSQKGENRGLGLYNVKQICDEYKMEISCENIEMENSNWLTFKMWKEKETI